MECKVLNQKIADSISRLYCVMLMLESMHECEHSLEFIGVVMGPYQILVMLQMLVS